MLERPASLRAARGRPCADDSSVTMLMSVRGQSVGQAQRVRPAVEGLIAGLLPTVKKAAAPADTSHENWRHHG